MHRIKVPKYGNSFVWSILAIVMNWPCKAGLCLAPPVYLTSTGSLASLAWLLEPGSDWMTMGPGTEWSWTVEAGGRAGHMSHM